MRLRSFMTFDLTTARRHRHSEKTCLRFYAACCVLVVACCAPALVADEAAALFQEGNQNYQAGDYQKATEAYEKILQLGLENWQVYYNLGNAYYKLRRPGKAILNYERARRLHRDNEDVRFNLDLANLQIADRIPAPPRSIVWVWLENVLRFFSLEGSAALALIFWAGLFSALIMNLVSRKMRWRQSARTLAWMAGALCAVFAGLFAYQYYDHQTSNYGIVMAPRVSVRSSPSQDATEVFILHEGTKANLEARAGEWTRIRLADGKVGWMLVSAVEKI